MELYLLCAFAFLAGFIDSIVGGGGLVQIPAFFVLYPQLLVPNVIGTNRLASAVGTSVAALNYARSVSIPWKTVLYAGVAATIFSYLGATVQSLLPSDVLKPIILVLIVVIAIYTYRKKDFGMQDELHVAPEKLGWWAAGIGAVLGFYNGFVGPGTGSLLVFGFVSVIGYNFLKASAVSKIVNVIADVASLVFFLMHKYVLFHLALPMMACNVAGAYVGSRMAVLRGNGFIRKVFIVVVAGIVARFAWDVFMKEDKNRLVFGEKCKLWLLNDKNASLSGTTPFILCFNKQQYQCYAIKSDGGLRKMKNDDVVWDVTDGGEWKLTRDSFYLKTTAIHQKYLSKDTLRISPEVFMTDVTDKFYLNNCDCKNLTATFRGGKIDSITKLLNYPK